ncbi:DUF4397 domain-containing protein [Pedobacter helvus]|uniref:DUF4397 domain-containing protein n=1 Tax=Pedobacter helvus TaxID=2563444 RepID=A0ABW9JHP5_9SPHI|nr:DUF4397 domain-containing protein [Pedobacter ureilyticus]
MLRSRLKIRKAGFVLGVMSTIVLGACKKETPVMEEGNTKVRFVNSYFNSDPQDFYQGNQKLTNQAVEYAAFGDYLPVKSGQTVLWSNSATEGKATAAIDAILYGNAQYTLFYYQTKDAKPAIAGYINEAKIPATGKYRVRFLNLALAFEDRSLIVKSINNTATVLDLALKFGDYPVYSELPVGTEIAVNVSEKNVLTGFGVNEFKEGKIYLVWFDTLDGVKVDFHVIEQ